MQKGRLQGGTRPRHAQRRSRDGCAGSLDGGHGNRVRGVSHPLALSHHFPYTTERVSKALQVPEMMMPELLGRRNSYPPPHGSERTRRRKQLLSGRGGAGERPNPRANPPRRFESVSSRGQCFGADPAPRPRKMSQTSSELGVQTGEKAPPETRNGEATSPLRGLSTRL